MERYFTLLSELTSVSDFLDNQEFTDVTQDGEIYTSYRVVKITHEARDHPDSWTHRANVARIRIPAIGVALLKIENRQVVASSVTLSQHSAD
jgi:hypothetical protein